MASTITERVFFKGRKLEFTLNPGPFNVKEHVLITIFANSGAGNVFSIYLVNAVKLFYKKELNFMVALVVVITSQVMGFGWAGLFRRYLVDPAAMWWPQNLVQVSLFRYYIYIYKYIYIYSSSLRFLFIFLVYFNLTVSMNKWIFRRWLLGFASVILGSFFTFGKCILHSGQKKIGSSLCPVPVSIEHIAMRTHVQNCTRIRILTGLVITDH